MRIGVSDKRIKLLLRTPPGEAVRGLQPAVAMSIRIRFGVLSAADSLKEAADAHPEWRTHRYGGSKTLWSIDVTGSTRLLFDYNTKAKEITNMTYDDPH
ncbi:type II toxin-antitoxin system RelE/ParE family toxin [Sphingomonas sp. 7/4-4]|jgi:plasmid maintenance system killer protein|uniref:type II toxin-antitoxin system RelE/ParE family toxin n=1 Tax=Sphingomonas sp. 7/4-4 TaxID=3018446 RepID=UPI0022F3C372|nr:type II toxin-antitoxin system RelE/ParE family toxin [Sphingomonas sp. 7/4-4]WBY06909.1 type II toxin-antitoxin system RelE/ParE family toxin [Sphingomonas sp. 7/4-4]